MCEATRPETCQVGDLAGKHGGKIAAAGNFVKPYLSTQPGRGFFLGGLSFVLHTTNTTRLTCANVVLVNGTGNATGTVSPIPSGTGTPQFTGAAGKLGVGVGALVAAVGAAIW
ncbi:hypothetical protein GQ44DRAFT_205109 [Phaeosphaeriaceae sp. PMI808]|nr:hypothetical protein GQ44DRAFT_205109 [Phaeosphaeriaceae sp. PMI808]